MSDIQGRDNVTVAEAALDADGRFLALRFTTWAAMGAYLSNFGPFIPTGAGAGMQNGLYAVPAIYVNVKGVMTNTVPTDAYRGAGRPEAAYMVERLVDHAGRVTGLGPAEIRRRNFIKPDQMPYKTALGDVYDSGEFEALMTQGMERADWAGFEARRAEAKARGKLRGIGLATYVERCSGGQPDTALIRFEDDDIVTLLMSNQNNGQGHQTLYTQVLSDQLGIDAERIRIVQGDTDRTPNGMTGGSRAAPVGGAAVLGVADKVKYKGRQIAAHLLEAAAVDIEYADGTFTVAGTDRSISLFDLARKAKDKANLPEGVEPGLDDDFTRMPEAATFPNGCHIAEVEVDPDTGVTSIQRYTVVDDFGGVVNPIMLMGQVHGGIVQGVGQALYEHTVYEEGSGQLLTGSFMDYAMPRADVVPMFDFTTRNVRCTTNPLGIKGAGEAGAIGAPPAVINALIDALAPATGLEHIDMPATPAAVWRALQGRQAA
jgi:carbon-monoxide dehydrogenase large subunit